MASLHGYVEFVKVLLDRGAQAKPQDKVSEEAVRVDFV